jgi:ethanolamine utilization protein EutN
MKLCRVLGPVVATAKHPAFHGHTLLVVQPLDERQNPAGPSMLAVDSVQAGVGDLVVVMSEGNGVRQILKQKNLPIRSLIVGIVDAVTLDDDTAAGGVPAAPAAPARAPRRVKAGH